MRTSRRAGFTLAEVLVATAIAAVVAAVTWAVVRMIHMDKAVGLAVKGVAAAAVAGVLVAVPFFRDLREVAAKLLSRNPTAGKAAR